MENNKGKIMLVDESENLRYVIKDYFEMEGYEVVDFKDGEMAAKAYNTDLYDLCIIDIILPGKVPRLERGAHQGIQARLR